MIDFSLRRPSQTVNRHNECPQCKYNWKDTWYFKWRLKVPLPQKSTNSEFQSSKGTTSASHQNFQTSPFKSELQTQLHPQFLLIIGSPLHNLCLEGLPLFCFSSLIKKFPYKIDKLNNYVFMCSLFYIISFIVVTLLCIFNGQDFFQARFLCSTCVWAKNNTNF